MSANLVTKLTIDALVTLAFAGPSDGAGGWRAWGPGVPGWHPRPKPETPDAIGGALYRACAEATLYPEERQERWPAPYVFEPMPCEVSVVDGLKTVACYRYQTAGSEGWEGSIPDVFCQWLERALIGALPGYEEAPWDWDESHVVARAERQRMADAVGAHQPPPDDAARIIETLSAAGVTLVPWTLPEGELPAEVDRQFADLRAPKIGHWGIGRFADFGVVQMRLYADEATAHLGYLVRRAVGEQTPDAEGWGWIRRVARHGRAVVELAATIRTYPGTALVRTPPERLAAALDRLGEPDEGWSSQDAPILFDRATRATVKLSVVLPVGDADSVVRLARAEQDRQRVVDLVEDESDRELLRAVDLDRQTIVVIPGFTKLDDITHARVQEVASPDERPRHQLRLAVEGERRIPAVIAAIDRLPVGITGALVHHPATSRTPRRFGVHG